jgi:hypothetical protein
LIGISPPADAGALRSRQPPFPSALQCNPL